MKAKNDAIQRVRDVRHRVSERFEHEPARVIVHYRGIEKRLKDRLTDQEIGVGRGGKRKAA